MLALPEDLDTPAVVVDLERLDANIAQMAARASQAGAALRPHAKTHKSVAVARRQLDAGATGLTVATLAEAEGFAALGCTDVFIAYPLWAGGMRRDRVRALAERVRLTVGVDGVAAAESVAAAAPGLGVMIEVDSGGGRTGVLPDGVRGLAEACLRRGLDVLGAFTHPGHAYWASGAASSAAGDESRALERAGAELATLLDKPPVLSGGSTPTVMAGIPSVLTEVRPGTYVFGDRQQVVGSDLPAEDVALVVAARVVSTPRPGEAVLDAGSKALSSDRPAWLEGFGTLPSAPDAVVAALTEEHAVVTGLQGQLAVGDLVAIVPNHVCTAVNLADELTIVREGVVVDRWPVLKRTRR